MSVVSNRHQSVSQHRWRENVTEDDIASVLVFLLLAILIAAAMFLPQSLVM
jgi:hypothetical protein